jgi:peptide/nickel transport system permease protein
MSRYILRRIGFLLLTLLLTSIIVFGVTQILPGDTARVILGREAGEAALESLRDELGLNDPLPVQYLRWLGNFIRGDWGESFGTEAEVRPLVMQRLGNSLMLAAVTLVIAVPAAIALGVIAGLNENKPVDSVVNVSALSVVGLPEFVTGILLIEIFAFQLGIFPANSSIRSGTSFLEALPMLILPALTASLVILAYISRMTRVGVIGEAKKPYVRTARLKGLSRWSVTSRHILRNALLPTIAVIAISFGWLISGLIVVENVYNYPGLGRLMIFAIDRRDLPLIQAVAMMAVLAFALANLAADLLSGYLNPKIRLQ